MRLSICATSRVRLWICLLGAIAAMLTLGGCASTCSQCGQAICLPDTCLQSADRPVMIDFYSPDCPGCQKIETDIDTLSVEYEGQAIIRKVHVHRYPGIAEAHQVRRLPTVVLYIRGREAKRWVQPRPANVYRTAIEKALRLMDVPEPDPARDMKEWSLTPSSDCSTEACAFRPADR